MDVELTPNLIKQWCGKTSFDKGAAYVRANKVTFTYTDLEEGSYTAIVQGKSREQVTIRTDMHGEVNAACTCPTLSSYDLYCQHIAAVLQKVHELQQTQQNAIQYSTSDKNQLASSILELFTDKARRSTRVRNYLDARTPLQMEFTCRPIATRINKFMFGIDMKVGINRLFVVKNIRRFLGAIERGEPYTFSKHFTYDPSLHSFTTENDEVIQQLLLVNIHEGMHDQSSIYSNRSITIPPIYWDKLLQRLEMAPKVRLVQGDQIVEGIHISEEGPSLQFEFNHSTSEGYYLDINGFDDITIMESYGVIVCQSRLVKLSVHDCNRLMELKLMMEKSNEPYIRIPLEQLDPYMDKVIPGLMKLGHVHIAKVVSERMVRTPLKAKLYLDRVKDRLLAGLEFEYGRIIIDPLNEENREQQGDQWILVRDGEQERRILDLMEQSAFTRAERGYFLADENAEYHFLYHIVPQLEKLLQVYATTAVKARIHPGLNAPKIVVDMDSRHDWLEFKFDIDGIPEDEIRDLVKSLEEKRRYYRLRNGALAPLEGEKFQKMLHFMNEMGIGTGKMVGSEIRVPVVSGLQVMDYQDKGATVSMGKSFRRLLENMRNPDLLDFPIPQSLSGVLRDYQQYGYQWMKTLAHYRFGGILADDMGLGKTLQGIAFIVSVLPEIRKRNTPALIIAPASLIYNWRNELKKFAPMLVTTIIDGTHGQRSRVLEDLSGLDVIITSYPLLRRDVGEYIETTFHTLILDEAQTFKNHNTQTAKAVKRIKARHRFALTGTPVENSIEELWSIFDVVFPELFSNKKTFANLTRGAIAKRIRPFILRRLKSDVLKELPDKIETVHISNLLPDQKKLYVAYLAELKHETVKHLKENSFQKNRIKILAGLTRLRQICCHPALFVPDYKGSSAKFEQLLETIEECRYAGKRVLIFSQFTEMLGLIRRELHKQDVSFMYLDGKTPVSERVDLCNRFNEGEEDVFLISLKAGGTGLNLTGADTVILYDLWWNPAVEEQATDRAHRMGQTNVVQVIRLVTQGTVEEKMYELQQKKKDLIDEVIQPGEQSLSTFSEQEIRDILMI
ncbi:DEAD/DEAH box helicase [Paenibacillus sp. CMAA1364]